jgi:predicted nuclease of restriction endonuclease-like (RecB) superfamily
MFANPRFNWGSLAWVAAADGLDVRRLIEQARVGVAVAVNVGQTMLYWQVGRRLGEEILGGQRAPYGERIIVELARLLEADYGRGFAEKNLRRMVQFAAVFSDAEIVATLSRQSSWSQFVPLLPIKDALAREFYAELCRLEGWSVRTLRAKIHGMLFEHTSLSRQPEQLVRRELATLRAEDRLTPDLVFRDPYLLDFVGLRGAFSEKDLEAALIRELGEFPLELGVGFTFVERQKRITVDGRVSVRPAASRAALDFVPSCHLPDTGGRPWADRIHRRESQLSCSV